MTTKLEKRLQSPPVTRKRTYPPEKTRAVLLAEYALLPDDARVDQKMFAARRNCSTALLERERWAGGGPPFIRERGTAKIGKNGRLQVFGGRIFYTKANIEDFLADMPTARSTTEMEHRFSARQSQTDGEPARKLEDGT